jgi:hypothetical protein
LRLFLFDSTLKFVCRQKETFLTIGLAASLAVALLLALEGPARATMALLLLVEATFALESEGRPPLPLLEKLHRLL